MLKGTSSVIATSSSATTSVTSASAQPSAPASTQQGDPPSSSWRNKSLIPGVVVGSIVGIGLVAGIVWYLRKRENRKAEQGNKPLGRRELYQLKPHRKELKEGHSELAEGITPIWQQHNENHSGQYIVEAPGYVTPKPPAELWEGNYRS